MGECGLDHFAGCVRPFRGPVPEARPEPMRHGGDAEFLAISEFPKWRKYLILLSFLDNSSARPVQIGGVDVNICHSRSTAVRGRRRSSSQSPPRGPFCRTRTGPVEADGAVDAQNAPTAPWKTLCVFHELTQGLSHQVTHEKLRKAPKYRWETRIDPSSLISWLSVASESSFPRGFGEYGDHVGDHDSLL